MRDDPPDQGDLFDDGIPPPYSREGTSEAAAASMIPTAGTLRRDVLDAITVNGGMTTEEVCTLLGLSGSTVRPRVWELRGEPGSGLRRVWIEDSGKTRKTKSGREAIVWRAR